MNQWPGLPVPVTPRQVTEAAALYGWHPVTPWLGPALPLNPPCDPGEPLGDGE